MTPCGLMTPPDRTACAPAASRPRVDRTLTRPRSSAFLTNILPPHATPAPSRSHRRSAWIVVGRFPTHAVPRSSPSTASQGRKEDRGEDEQCMTGGSVEKNSCRHSGATKQQEQRKLKRDCREQQNDVLRAQNVWELGDKEHGPFKGLPPDLEGATALTDSAIHEGVASAAGRRAKEERLSAVGEGRTCRDNDLVVAMAACIRLEREVRSGRGDGAASDNGRGCSGRGRWRPGQGAGRRWEAAAEVRREN
ncbi:hypothetical protein GUJ93_ZPchr0009g990 [Zizania palustris]|uniref:Uncharacterized protein n=1 Tax=Zizania palustris TaxID=103762 RepID=A0A8J5VMW3_ZIZPA|nr:hypothetical protein GUJ93_ZPchr0009g990 [Zizania palustris]